jgi:hypothetical protein
MKASELMIGNWILYGEKPVQVLQLTSEKIYKGFIQFHSRLKSWRKMVG